MTAKGRKRSHEFRRPRTWHGGTTVGSDLLTLLQPRDPYGGAVTLNLNCLIFLSQPPDGFAHEI